MPRNLTAIGRIAGFRGVVFSTALFLFATLAGSVTARELASQRVASDLDYPVFATSPPGDPRLFIVEQGGQIKILKHGQVLPTLFLDIHTLVSPPGGFEQRGLFGIAFHPQYASNRFFYLMYSDVDWRTTVVRYRASASNPDIADPASAFLVLKMVLPAPNHHGGTLNFGPNDGYLYIGIGDGGEQEDPFNFAQRDDLLFGKMLRIDVNNGMPYGIPPSNPFVGPGLPLDEIWAKGFRNPYRWSFDRETGDMYIGDVGQGAWEEVDYQSAGSKGGENYGWRIMEGNHCFNPPQGCNTTGLVRPIHEYPHIPDCSVTGGYIYRGSAIPSAQGTYFFADFCTGKIWSFRYQNGLVSNFIDRTEELSAQGEVEWIGSFAEDSAGELYMVDRGIVLGQGEIWRIVPGGGTSGVADADIPSEAALRLVPASPNPFSKQTQINLRIGYVPSSLRAIVYSAAGRFVDELAVDPVALGSGAAALEWDGRDAHGLPCPSGIYMLRVAADGQEARERLILIR